MGARAAAATCIGQARALIRSWTFLVAPWCLPSPHILPVMETESIFGSQRDTILSGVTFLWRSGSWPLAVIVFVASVMVPLLKMLAMLTVLIAVHRGVLVHRGDLSRLYRALEVIGRWSMLDVYVVAVLVTLVQSQLLGTVTPGAGASAQCGT